MAQVNLHVFAKGSFVTTISTAEWAASRIGYVFGQNTAVKRTLIETIIADGIVDDLMKTPAEG